MLGCIVQVYAADALPSNAIAAARISGIVEDLDLTDSEFQTCVSILFVGLVLHRKNLMRVWHADSA